MTIIPNMVGLASGTARRIGQAEGPFEIKFRDIGDDDEETVAFIQIDGEFFRCRNKVTKGELLLRLQKVVGSGSELCRVCF